MANSILYIPPFVFKKIVKFILYLNLFILGQFSHVQMDTKEDQEYTMDLTFKFNLNKDAIDLHELDEKAVSGKREAYPTIRGWDELESEVNSITFYHAFGTQCTKFLIGLRKATPSWMLLAGPASLPEAIRQPLFRVCVQPAKVNVDWKKHVSSAPVLQILVVLTHYYTPEHIVILAQCVDAFALLKRQKQQVIADTVRSWLTTDPKPKWLNSGDFPTWPQNAFGHIWMLHYLHLWPSRLGGLNRSSMLRPLDLIFRYGCHPAALLSIVHDSTQNQIEMMDFGIRRAAEISNDINNAIQLQRLFDKSPKPEMEMDRLALEHAQGRFSLFKDESSRKSMEAMFQVIQDTDTLMELIRALPRDLKDGDLLERISKGTMDKTPSFQKWCVQDASLMKYLYKCARFGMSHWFKIDGLMSDPEPGEGDSDERQAYRRVGHKILRSHPAMKKIDGSSKYWLTDQFRLIYQHGYKRWVHRRLANMGVAWDLLSLDQVIEDWVPECVLYKLLKHVDCEPMIPGGPINQNSKKQWPSKKYTPLQVWNMANKKMRESASNKLMPLIQTCFGHLISNLNKFVDRFPD